MTEKKVLILTTPLLSVPGTLKTSWCPLPTVFNRRMSCVHPSHVLAHCYTTIWNEFETHHLYCRSGVCVFIMWINDQCPYCVYGIMWTQNKCGMLYSKLQWEWGHESRETGRSIEPSKLTGGGGSGPNIHEIRIMHIAVQHNVVHVCVCCVFEEV